MKLNEKIAPASMTDVHLQTLYALRSTLSASLANRAWQAASWREYFAFRHAAQNGAQVQERMLQRMLAENAATVYGQRYGFASIRNGAEYRQRVPLQAYEDYQADLDAIAQGNTGVLTAAPVWALVPTSGSSAAAKLIPYTAQLQAAFQRAVSCWMIDLFLRLPDLRNGPAYWAISPIARQPEQTPGGLPIGFEDDSAYLGGIQQRITQALFAVPSWLRLIEDIESFRYVALLFLLRAADLRLVSVWHPSFFMLLLQRLPEWWDRLAYDIAHGTLSPPQPLRADLALLCKKQHYPLPRRAAAIRKIMRGAPHPLAYLSQLWPHLRLISCWTDAAAQQPARNLQVLFPQALVQGKGLLATEGVVSFPLLGRTGAALALRSHVFEFLPSGEAERTLLPHQLEPGRRYSVVLTNGAGLYRYRTHDVVEVTGWLDGCPLLRFIGRDTAVSDYFGEKLHEVHVQAVLDRACATVGLTPAFAMLAYDSIGLAYTLYIEAPGIPDDSLLWLGQVIEQGLSENRHYHYCRDLGQLGPLRLFRISQDGVADYLETCRSRFGQRSGDIKPVALERRTGWSASFQGHLIALPIAEYTK